MVGCGVKTGIRVQFRDAGGSGTSSSAGGRCGGDRRAKKVQGTFPSRRRRASQEGVATPFLLERIWYATTQLESLFLQPES
jgi:hypothetical protein